VVPLPDTESLVDRSSVSAGATLMTLVVRQNEHAGLVDLPEAIDAIEQGFAAWGRDPSVNILRQVIHKQVRLAVHQALAPDLQALGLYAHAGYDNGVSLLFHAETGQLEAMVLGRILCPPPADNTDLRTPATSAVGTRWLARQDAHTAGVLGSGRQARGHLVATAAVRQIESAKVYSPTVEHCVRFADEMSEALGIPIEAVASAREAVEGLDIVLVTTDTAEPVVLGDWLQPGQHVTSVMGGNTPRDANGRPLREARRDLDDRVVERSNVIVINSRAQAEQDGQGDLMVPIERGILTWDRVGELGELVGGRTPGRTSAEQITLFKNNAGQGIADVALAALVARRARELGRGAAI